ncbi:MAG: DUF2892 domain-containing protein [Spirosomaceae bacterium]|jgi:hypothetical protein|nr:DUF2892 domain-containing protein [Spirosomataceae bacterium]
MKKNVGKTDATIRIILALITGFLYLTGSINGTLGIVAIVLAVVFLLTSFVGFCPLYTLFGFNSCSINPKNN